MILLPPSPAGASRKRVLLAVKIAASVAFLAYLVAAAPWNDVLVELQGLHAGYLLAYALLSLVATAVSAAKWQRLSETLGIHATFGRFFSLYLVGYFFNQFLPTSTGGDVVRAYELGKPTARTSEALASVFMERLTGLATLMALVVFALAYDPRFFRDPILMGIVGTLLGALLVVGTLALRPSLMPSFRIGARLPRLKRLLAGVEKVRGAIGTYGRHSNALVHAVLYSLLFYATTILVVYAGCLAFDARVSLAALAAAVPVMLLVFNFPLSIGGVGLQEWAYYAVLTQIGVPAAVGVGLGLIFRVRTLIFGVVGGVLYPFLRDRGDRSRERERTVRW